ncbi:MAG: FRG domain-containing protein [Gemmatimonadaceae bacterium]
MDDAMASLPSDLLELLTHSRWRAALPPATSYAVARTPLDAPADHDPARRAEYFRAMAPRVNELGIHSPDEPDLLTLLPPHADPPERVPALFASLGYPSEVAARFASAGLSVISLPLVAGYFAGETQYSLLVSRRGLASERYLLDPNYGVVIWREGGDIRHHCFALGAWLRETEGLGAAHMEARAHEPMRSLVQGVEFGRLLFQPVFGAQVKPAYDALEVAEVVVERPSTFAMLVDGLRRLTGQVAPKVQLWFRGQPQDYQMPDRGELARAGVLPYGDVRQSSLVPALYRGRGVDGSVGTLADYERFVRHVGDWLFRASTVFGPAHTTRRAGPAAAPGSAPGATATVTLSVTGRRPAVAPTVPDPGWESQWDVRDAEGRPVDRFTKAWHVGLSSYQRGLVLQHYGCPTAWLDITRDPMTALWFALHEMTETPEGHVVKPCTWEGSDRARWPTVMIFTLVPGAHTFLDTGTILQGTPALRPQRQQCGLLGGAGNVARNYGARYLALKIRLAPGFAMNDGPTAEKLFPGPEEDGVLARLLDAEAAAGEESLFPVVRLRAPR